MYIIQLNKVKLSASQCVVRQFFGNVYTRQSYITHHTVFQHSLSVINVYYFKPYKVKLTTSFKMALFIATTKKVVLVFICFDPFVTALLMELINEIHIGDFHNTHLNDM